MGKNIKTNFPDFVNEMYEAQRSRAVVDQSKVKRGMTAEDYNNEKWTVEKVVPAKDFRLIKKYDESGAMADGIESPGDYGIDMNTSFLIAVKSEERNETAVFVYGPDGACVWSDNMWEDSDLKSLKSAIKGNHAYDANEKMSHEPITMDGIQKAIDAKGLILAKTDQKINPWFCPTEIDGDVIWATDDDGKKHELKLQDVENIVINESMESKIIFKNRPLDKEHGDTIKMSAIINSVEWFFSVGDRKFSGPDGKTTLQLTVWTYDKTIMSKINNSVYIYERNKTWLVPGYAWNNIPKEIWEKIEAETKIKPINVDGDHPGDPEYWKGRKEKRFMT